MHKEDKTGAHGQGAQHRGDNLGALVRDRGYVGKISWCVGDFWCMVLSLVSQLHIYELNFSKTFRKNNSLST